MLTIRLPRPVDETPITVLAPVAEPEKKRTRRRPEEIVRWRCTECYEEHDDEDDAAECCPEEDEEVGCGGMLLETGEVRCPRCGNANDDYEEAVDCCMWKTHGPAERRELAQQMRTYGYLLDSALVGVVTDGPLVT
ncbi:hypothetical protein [Cupriavidus taiwanensis]|uniref:hypothetical protein n=1 Tax=Cupriavidus taiwanensis TaxID=164546 RepID=UPI000E109EE0|nr:hypothetical protein [Cupriavidus taiwanensis]SOY56812.1 hypothetical protein CBM2592_A90107 [Cupriavidus taiwanensis]SOY90714.1 hypothetical protein CBM2591_A90106 [Cupriavidus taiwanensis]SOZ63519.1 hypothetical protein CBM2617_A70083 [Cupriavidus taiwanensis]SOZ82532.1 hypothetical protein CBM2618_A80084 [Cupriavidus taiwanensis]SOZ84404.1 hypothetical protein CBM2622_A80083 [Cupriavidus taiwanensis]